MAKRILPILALTSGLILTLLSIAKTARAQEVIDVTQHEFIQSDDAPTAQSQLMDKAVDDVSLANIKEMIGQDKLQHSMDAVENKIVKNSSRYVLSMSTDNIKREGDGYSINVQMRISLKSLRAMLLENGLLYQLEGPPKVLPVIQFQDRVAARSYGWWYTAHPREVAYLHNDSVLFDKSLKSELMKIGFYAIAPSAAHLYHGVPEPYRNENLQRVDDLFLGEFFKSSIVLRGQVIFHTKPGVNDIYLIDLNLQAFYSNNGRRLAEITRSFETDPGAFRDVVPAKLNEVIPQVCADLSAQFGDAWKRGTFGSSVVNVVVNSRMSPKQFEDFRSAVVLQIRDIKAFRESIIAAHQVTFEADSSALAQQLAQSFKAAKFAQFKVDVTDVGPDGVVLRVKPI